MAMAHQPIQAPTMAQALLMTLYEFLRLDLSERMAQVVDAGEYITGDPSKPSNFYALYGFYVEVQLDHDAEGILAAIPFNKGDRYDRMVMRINVALL